MMLQRPSPRLPTLALPALCLLAPLASQVSACDSTCEAYRHLGALYDNPDGTLLQRAGVVARFQYQLGYVDGEAGDDAFDSGWHDEVRRFYAGAYFRAFGFLDVSGQANLSSDDGSDRDYEFQHMWDLAAKLDVNALRGEPGAADMRLGYGAREVNMSREWNTSSKMIYTVERSAIANRIWPYNNEFSNPTGLFVEVSRDDLAATAGIFSTTSDDYWADWDDGELYYLRLGYSLDAGPLDSDMNLLWTAFYQDVDRGQQALSGGLDWATSVSARFTRGDWSVDIEGILGDNGDSDGAGAALPEDRRDLFGGVVLLPRVWLYEKTLEGVFRYQYQASESPEGIRLNSRYVRRSETAEQDTVIPLGGRGDEHHSLYLGVNYLVWGDNLKFMLGVEYDDIVSGSEDVYSGWTGFAAARTFF